MEAGRRLILENEGLDRFIIFYQLRVIGSSQSPDAFVAAFEPLLRGSRSLVRWNLISYQIPSRKNELYVGVIGQRFIPAARLDNCFLTFKRLVQKLIPKLNLDRGEWVAVQGPDGKTRNYFGDCRLRNQTMIEALAEEERVAKEDGAVCIAKSDSFRPALPKSPSRK